MSVPVWCVDITCVVMYLMVCTRFECLDVFFFFNYVVVVVDGFVDVITIDVGVAFVVVVVYVYDGYGYVVV